MHIKDHATAQGWFRKHAAAPSSVGSWKAFVARNKKVQEPRAMAQEPRIGLQGGQLVQPGPRAAFRDAGIVGSMTKRYNLDDAVVSELNTLYENISNYKKTNDPSVVKKRINDFATEFKRITGRLPVANEISSFGAGSVTATSTNKSKYLIKGVNFIEETDLMKKTKRIDVRGTEIEKKIVDAYNSGNYTKADGTPNINRMAKDLYPDRPSADGRKMVRKTLERMVDYEGKANIAGPETGAKELKKRRLKIEKELRQYWKGQKGGELILKQMDKKLADIAAENKKILKMSDDAIWNNKKFKDAMQLNVKKLTTGEGLSFDRYEGISKKDFVKKVKDLAEKGQFVQAEHIIPLKNKNPDSLLTKNIFKAYGKVGGQMEVLKDFSKANTFGKRSKEVFNFLKGQNIPIEKPGFWKTTKKVGSKVGRWAFGPVEMGTLPLFLAGEALYANYANKRDLKKALDEIPNSKLPQYRKNLLLEGYSQEARDIGGVGLESYALDQPNISGALEKIGYGDKNELMRDAAGAIAGIREQEQAARTAELERQRKIFDPYAPMAGGGLANLTRTVAPDSGGILSLKKKW